MSNPFKMTAEFAKANFSYDPESGVISRITSSGLRPCIKLDDKGYIAVYVGNKRFAAHALHGHA